MRKLKEHINRWGAWRRNVKCGLLHKLLVLFKLRTDISFELTFADKERLELLKRELEK